MLIFLVLIAVLIAVIAWYIKQSPYLPRSPHSAPLPRPGTEPTQTAHLPTSSPHPPIPSPIPPSAPWVLLEKAESFCRQRKFEEALRCLNAALEPKPGIKPTWLSYDEAQGLRLDVLLRLGRLEEALSLHETLLEAYPDYALGHQAKGLILDELGRHEEALHSLNRAIELKPNFAAAHHSKGIVLDHLGQLAESFQSLRTALKFNPSSKQAQISRRIVFEKIQESNKLDSYTHELNILKARLRELLHNDLNECHLKVEAEHLQKPDQSEVQCYQDAIRHIEEDRHNQGFQIADEDEAAINVLKSILSKFDDSKIGVSIVIGFFGSGKTTFANHIIHSQPNVTFVALAEDDIFAYDQYKQNENGSIPLLHFHDKYLTSRQDGSLRESVHLHKWDASNENLIYYEDFSAVRLDHRTGEYLYRTVSFLNADHLFVELAEFTRPDFIMKNFLGPVFEKYVRLDDTVAVLDAVNVDIDLFNTDEIDEAAALNGIIKYADIILLNKADLVDEARLSALEARIREVKAANESNTRARILRCIDGKVPLPLVSRLGLKRIDDYRCCLLDRTVSLVTFESDHPFSFEKFQHFSETQITSNIYKAIGTLWFDERKSECLMYEFSRAVKYWREWDTQPKNQLVLIGQNLDAESLKAQLQGCLVPES